MKNKIYEDCSSLRYFNFEGWTKEKIIEKYEHVLTSREKQITDLSIEIGTINDRLNFLGDKCKKLDEENEMLKNRLQKRENILNQELNNKEIMFMRLERTEQERDEMKKKIEKLEKMHSGKSYGSENQLRDIPKGFNNSTNVNLNVNSNFFDNSNIKSEKNIGLQNDETKDKLTNVEKNLENTFINQKNESNNNVGEISKATQPAKPSALDKIRELKERKNNPASSNRISLTGSMIENIPSNNIVINENKLEEKDNSVMSNNDHHHEEDNIEKTEHKSD